jgi:hypothetical protein
MITYIVYFLNSVLLETLHATESDAQFVVA